MSPGLRVGGNGIGEPEPPLGIALMLTRRCNMACSHCSVESGPKIKGEPSDAELIATVHAIADSGLKALQITGGEPMIREKLVFEILRIARKRGLVTTLSSNGFWGRKPATAWRKVAALKRAGLGRVTISYDRYHAEFQGPEPALNIARAAEWFDLPLNVNITRVKDDPELAGLVAPFEKRHQLKMRFYDVQVIGRARELPLAEMRGELTGFCNAACAPAITDDGRLTACNGPAYFLERESPLVIGSTRETPLAELVDRHTDDPILETIRRAGPLRLLRELEDAGVARDLGIRRQHSGMCDLCIDINSNPAAVAVLRERLGTSRYQAELAARRMVIRTSMADRVMGIEYANGPGVVKLWVDGAAGRADRFDATAEKIFGRADFDWNRSAEYLVGCGMSHPLAGVIDRQSVKKWAPTFFVERVREGAVKYSILDLTQREIVRRLSQALSSIGARGVLLKGAAILAIDEFGGERGRGNLPRRSAGDVDLYVSEADASKLWDVLLELGFKGSRGASRTGPHHLAPLSFNGVQVEIHTRIMPAFWGLPEADMLHHTRGIDGLPSIETLDAEGMLLHALTHSTAHLFSHGMRAAWDATWLMERNPALDVSRMLAWIEQLAMPRSFWVPARVLARSTVALPPELMAHAPTDDRQRRLETVAEARIYSAIEGAFDLNPISKNGFFLMLHDSTFGKVRHVASLFGREERESRRTANVRAKQRDPGSGHSALAIQLREGMTHWRQFQRSVSR
jgi:hypothetical protein